jgi:hypothetical protein
VNAPDDEADDREKDEGDDDEAATAGAAASGFGGVLGQEAARIRNSFRCRT